MARYVLSPSARKDMEIIVQRSAEQFGDAAADRYLALLIQAIDDVAENPRRPGAHHRPEIVAEARTYHLLNSCKRVPLSLGRVAKPRHLLLYRMRGDSPVEIGRVLHDSMDLASHLPAGHAAE